MATDNELGGKFDASLDPLSVIKNLRLRNVNKVIIGNININSLPNKFEQLKELAIKHIDVLVITETKLDDSFPTSQFLMKGFAEPFRLDRNRNGGGVMIYIRNDIPSRLLSKHVFPSDIKGLYIELNFRKCKWLLLGTYHRPSQSDQYYFDNLDKSLDTYSNYEKILLVGDFNAQTTDQYLSSFLYQHELSSIVKESTCFKNVSNPSCIDLFLTNSALSFQNTQTVSCGLSDVHKLVITFSKNKPREIVYRNYKYFNSQNFNDELKFVFSKENIDSCTKFNQTFLNVLNKYAPLKKKQLRASHYSYVSKSMRKAIKRRFYLENVYFKKRMDKSLRAYKKQKNYCSRLFKKERKKFFNKLNPSFFNDNKLFWKTIKPFFSNKGSSGSNIKLVEKDEILQDD